MLQILQITTALIPLIFSYKIEKSIFGPSTIGNAIWIASALIGIPGANPTTFSVGLILVQFQLLIYTLFTIAGEATADKTKITNTTINASDTIRFSRLLTKIVFLILMVNGIASIVLPVMHAGIYSISIESISDASEELSLGRYSGESLPGYMNAMLGILYSHCILWGWIMGSEHKLPLIGKISVHSAPICILAYSIISTARLTVLIGFIFMSAGYAGAISIKEIKIKKNLTKMSIKKFTTFLVIVIILLSVFIIAGGMRAGEFDIAILTKKLSTYAAGIQGLGEWIASSNTDSITLGTYTFAGPANLLGITTREIGIIQDYYSLPDGQKSNLYTGLRWLIEDFTIIGASIILALYGLISGRIWKNIRTKSTSLGPVYVLILCITLSSPIYSLFAYNSLILAIIFFYVMIKFNFLKDIKTSY